MNKISLTLDMLKGKKWNLHTHTMRCGHAVGSEREYIENAIEAKYEVLGFADHAPYLFNDGHKSRIRMGMEELDDYVNTIYSLRKEYEKDITIYCGLEMEYFPEEFEKSMEMIQKYPIEYFVLGQHYYDTERAGMYTGSEVYDEGHLRIYVDRIMAALNTEKFLYVAHPDIINYVGLNRIYEKHMIRLLDEFKRRNMPVEINVNGLRDRRWYPSKRLIQMAVENKNDFIIGIDAHDPRDLVDYVTYDKAVRWIEECHRRVINI